MLWGDMKLSKEVTSISKMEVSIYAIWGRSMVSKGIPANCGCKLTSLLDANGLSDPYFEIGQVVNGAWHALFKTKVEKKTLDPYYQFNPKSSTEAASFEINPSLPLVFMANDWDMIGTDDFMGSFEFDMRVLYLAKERSKKQRFMATQRVSGLKRNKPNAKLPLGCEHEAIPTGQIEVEFAKISKM